VAIINIEIDPLLTAVLIAKLIPPKEEMFLHKINIQSFRQCLVQTVINIFLSNIQ
jgi:hypothetical protein